MIDILDLIKVVVYTKVLNLGRQYISTNQTNYEPRIINKVIK